MNVRLFANTSRNEFHADSEGASFDPPRVVVGSDLLVRFRLVEDIEGETVADPREVVSMAARAGWPDRAPEQGSYRLSFTLGADTSAETGAIAFDAAEGDVQAAIDGVLTGPLAPLAPCRVREFGGGLRLTFADQGADVGIACTDNELWPASFVDADEISWDGGKAWVLQIRQTPAAEVTDWGVSVSPPPTVTRKQAGSEVDGVRVNEIQRIDFPPAYAGGTVSLRWNGRKSEIFTVPTNVETLEARLEELAEEGGVFFVTPGRDFAFIEFRGEMAGQGWDLIEVDVFEDPPADYWFVLPTDTDEFRTLMRGADDSGEIDVPLDVAMVLDDALTGLEERQSIRAEFSFARAVSDGRHNVAASLQWNQPRGLADNRGWSPDAMMVGNRSVARTIGDGVSTSFVINHDLVAGPQVFSADAGTDVLTAAEHGLHNGDPVELDNDGGALPAGLSEGVTYFVVSAGEDTFQVSETVNGAPVDVTDAGTGTHSVRLRDGAMDAVLVEVWETGGSQARVSPSAYTVEKSSAGSVTVSGFSSVPGVEEYVVVVMTAGRPATYQGHNHSFYEYEGAPRIEALEAAVALLEAATGSVGGLSRDAGDGVEVARWVLPRLWEIYPSRTQLPRPESGILADVDLDAVDEESGQPLLGRPRGLLPAVHDETPEVLPVPLPTPTEDHVGKVYRNDGDDPVLLTGGSGHRSREVAAGGFAGSNGLLWYPLRQYGQWEGAGVSVDSVESTEDWMIAEGAEVPAVGTKVQLETDGTLPAGFATGTDYWVLAADAAAGVVQLAAGADEEVPVSFSDDGSGSHSLVMEGEISYYPEHFERELFVLHVNDRQLRPRKDFELSFAFQAAVLRASTAAVWYLMVEIGQARGVSTVGSEGGNLEEMVWRRIPALEQRIVLTPVATSHRFGLRVRRRMVDGKDVLGMDRVLYGGSDAGGLPPASANFAVRARLGRFDTEDEGEDAHTGFVMLSGLDVSSDGVGSPQLGRAFIG